MWNELKSRRVQVALVENTGNIKRYQLAAYKQILQLSYPGNG